MTNLYLEKMLKRRNLSYNAKFQGGGSEEDKAKKKAEKLAQKITKTILQAFSNLKEKDKIKEAELQKVAKLTFTNPIDLNFGGGFLIFGPDLQINSMTHIFNKDTKLFYFERPITSTIEKDIVNNGIESDTPYNIDEFITSVKKQTIHKQ